MAAKRQSNSASIWRGPDVMTREVITVSDTTELADIAVLLETNGIKRVPVITDGKLVGIISRANLIRALAATESGPDDLFCQGRGHDPQPCPGRTHPQAPAR